MHVARVRLFFAFVDDNAGDEVQCALVSWYTLLPDCDPDTGMWMVQPEDDAVQVIELSSIVRGAHLLPKYGIGALPDGVNHTNSLDAFKTYFVNPFIDHHCHELLAM